MYYFSVFPEIEEVSFCGSRAKGTNKPRSDIDLGIKNDFPYSYPERLRNILEEAMHLAYFFDVPDDHKISNPRLQ
ncbi:MAG: nucleotidyltransferase domain-containing protein [Ginsengibacter sp.]